MMISIDVPMRFLNICTKWNPDENRKIELQNGIIDFDS